MAVNLSSGEGLHYLFASPQDLSAFSKVTEFKWPPLLTILLAGLLRVFGNMTLSTGILIAGSFILMFLSIRSILNALFFSNYIKWALWILFLFNPILTDVFSVSDIFSLSVWISGFALFIRYVQTGNRPHLLFWSFILYLPAAIRYQYYPLVFIIPALFFLTAENSEKKQYRRTGLILFAGVALFLSIQILILKSTGGQGAYIADIVEWSPKNLERLYPFFINAFAPFYLLINKGIEANHLDVKTTYRFFGFISILLFVGFSVLAFGTRNNNLRVKKAFIFPIVFILIYLSALSIMYREQNNGGATFTYVQESRYWGLMYLLLPILAALMLKTTTVKRVFLVSAFILLLIPNVIRTGKLLLTEDDSALYSHKMAFKRALSAQIERDQLKKMRPVVIACFDRDFAMYNADIPYATLPLDSLFSQSQIHHSVPVWLYVITRDTISETQAAWMASNGMQETQRRATKYRLFERKRAPL